jgi:hypothetical protein
MASIWKITECGRDLVTPLNTLQPEREKLALDQISEAHFKGFVTVLKAGICHIIDQETDDTAE